MIFLAQILRDCGIIIHIYASILKFFQNFQKYQLAILLSNLSGTFIKMANRYSMKYKGMYKKYCRFPTLSAGPSLIPRHLTSESCDSSSKACPSTSWSYSKGATAWQSGVVSKYLITSAILHRLTETESIS